MDEYNGTVEMQSITWAGGSYVGELINGVPQGKGKLRLPDGTSYEGVWLEGKPHGKGIIYYPSGAYYQGEFKNGTRDGYGEYVPPDGRMYSGLWKKGEFVRHMAEMPGERPLPELQPHHEIISIESLSFIYGSGKGIFDLNFSVSEGEVFGYLGPNGAGKTTTIRNLLGFTKPSEGRCTINGLDCWRESSRVQYLLGYLPGEISFFDEMSGIQFLKLIGDMKGRRGNSRRNALVERFELDPSGKIRRMSKGMKQKLGLVAAFMHDPAVYILDEPTSGLDPLMQNVFVELILEEKERGKTVLMSSHNFEETYRTCDRAGIIRDGQLVAVEDMHSLKSSQRKAFLVTVGSSEDLEILRSAGLEIGSISKNTVEVFVSGNYAQFTAALAACNVLGLDVVTQSLEQVFMKFYGREELSI